MKLYFRLLMFMGILAMGSPGPALGQCSASIFWNGGTPASGTQTANGTILGTVGVSVTSSGSFAAGRPIYTNSTDTYNGFTWRSLRTIRGASFASGTFTRFDFPIPLNPAYIHLRVSDIRGDFFNTEHQRVEAFLNGVPVAVNFEDPVNGAFITGGNVINGASTTTPTVQSSMRAFFAGPVNRIVVTCTGLSDYVVVDLFARCDILLPFELTGFEAKRAGEVVNLIWTATQEEGVLAYGVERSADAIQWKRIGQVDAIRAPGMEKQYRFTDRQPLPGTGYYRLKSIEPTGPGQYSRVLTVRSKAEAGIVAKAIYPNPATDQLVLEVSAGANGPWRASFQSADGKSVQTVTLQRGINRVSCDRWPRGYYFVTVTSGDGVTQRERLVLR